MAQVLILIMVAAVAISSFAQGFVLPHYAQLIGVDYEYVEETTAAPTPTPSYIMRIAQPNVLGEPGVAEVTQFIDAAAAPTNQPDNTKLAKSEDPNVTNKKSTADATSVEQWRQGKTLTYTELDKLLANWQMDKERNAYEMQAGKQYGVNARHY